MEQGWIQGKEGEKGGEKKKELKQEVRKQDGLIWKQGTALNERARTKPICLNIRHKGRRGKKPTFSQPASRIGGKPYEMATVKRTPCLPSAPQDDKEDLTASCFFF